MATIDERVAILEPSLAQLRAELGNYATVVDVNTSENTRESGRTTLVTDVADTKSFANSIALQLNRLESVTTILESAAGIEYLSFGANFLFSGTGGLRLHTSIPTSAGDGSLIASSGADFSIFAGTTTIAPAASVSFLHSQGTADLVSQVQYRPAAGIHAAKWLDGDGVLSISVDATTVTVANDGTPLPGVLAATDWRVFLGKEP